MCQICRGKSARRKFTILKSSKEKSGGHPLQYTSIVYYGAVIIPQGATHCKCFQAKKVAYFMLSRSSSSMSSVARVIEEISSVPA